MAKGVGSNAKAEAVNVFKRAIDISSSKVASKDAAIKKAKEAKKTYDNIVDTLSKTAATEEGFKSLSPKLRKEFLKGGAGEGKLANDAWWAGDDLYRASFIKNYEDKAIIQQNALDSLENASTGIFFGDSPISETYKSRAAGAKAFMKDFYSPSVNGWGVTGLRAGATGLAYMGLATGARYINGGTFTRNSSGERDIAGVPFI